MTDPEQFNDAVLDALPTVKPNGLVIKLCKIMGELGYVEKRGENKFKDGKTKYMYATEADLVAAVRDKLAEAHIFIFPDALSTSREGQLTDVMIAWTFVDGDTGETYTCRMPGCGSDFEDKGIYKAITGSEKYLLMKSFLIPTGDDPEKNSKGAAEAVAEAKIGAAKKVSVTFSPSDQMFIWGPGCALIDTVLKSSGTKNVLGQWMINKNDGPDVMQALGEAGIEVKEEPYTAQPSKAAQVPPAAAPKAEAVKPRPSLPGEVDGKLIDATILQTKNKQPFCAVIIVTPMGQEIKASIFDNPQLDLADGSSTQLFALLVEHKGQAISAVLKVSGKYTNLIGVTRLGDNEWELTGDGPIPVRQSSLL